MLGGGILGALAAVTVVEAGFCNGGGCSCSMWYAISLNDCSIPNGLSYVHAQSPFGHVNVVTCCDSMLNISFKIKKDSLSLNSFISKNNLKTAIKHKH